VSDSKTRSITDKLANLAKMQGVQYHFVLTTFLIQQLLVRLIRDKHTKRHLVFKGGFVLLRVYESPRYTIDLDASLEGISTRDIMPLVISAVQDGGDAVAWYRFQKTVDLETQGEYGGLRFVFRAGLGAVPKDISRAQIVHLDLGVGDAVTGESREMPMLLSDEGCVCTIYPCEVIVAEKIHSLVTRSLGNSRSKDIFDIAHLAERIKHERLRLALTETFQARGDELPVDLMKCIQTMDTSVLRRGWSSAVSSISNPQSFDKAFDTLVDLTGKLEL
jgi:predicted nucleotidyltransferase component of viral defense system